MEFTLNVNINLSESTENAINRLADAFGSTKSSQSISDLEVEVLEAKIDAVSSKTDVVKSFIDKAISVPSNETEEATAPKTRTRKPTPKPEIVEETKPEVTEEAKPEEPKKGEGEFIPNAPEIRKYAVPLAKAGHKSEAGLNVKDKLTELGHAGIGQLLEAGTNEQILDFYTWCKSEFAILNK